MNNGLTLGASDAGGSWVGGVVTSTKSWDGGYFQVEAKMPSTAAANNGAWPAIWMLPAPGQPTVSGCDAWEIDNFEGGMGTGSSASSSDPYANDYSLHTNHTSSCGSVQTVGQDVNSGINLGSGYHTYGMAWVPGQSITWYLDGKEMGKITSAQIPIPSEPMELILNLGIASQSTSSWHSYPGETAPTPSSMAMQVSGVQVWQ